MSKHNQVMDSLAAKHDVLLSILKDNPIHYLDVPFYGNVGDLLIMKGTLSFFRQNQLDVSRMGTYFNYLPSWANRNDVIVFQGGGNFGDIYGPFQGFRERIIAALPNNRIVILPQSIHFDNPENLAKCCALMRQHRDLHICVRDSVSAGLAAQMSPNVYLLPDMAHQLWPIKRKSPASLPVLRLQRRDSEKSTDFNNSQSTFDWIDLIGKPWTFFLAQVAERSMYHATRIGINKPFANLEAKIWITQANKFIDRAVELFTAYERVESDRLHAHILACLLSIPNRISDNSYGKNSRYMNEWTNGSNIVESFSVSNKRDFI